MLELELESISTQPLGLGLEAQSANRSSRVEVEGPGFKAQ